MGSPHASQQTALSIKTAPQRRQAIPVLPTAPAGGAASKAAAIASSEPGIGSPHLRQKPGFVGSDLWTWVSVSVAMTTSVLRGHHRGGGRLQAGLFDGRFVDVHTQFDGTVTARSNEGLDL